MALVVALLFRSIPLARATCEGYPLEEEVRAADLIVEGRIVSAEARAPKMGVQLLRVSVDRVYKSPLPVAEVGATVEVGYFHCGAGPFTDRGTLPHIWMLSQGEGGRYTTHCCSVRLSADDDGRRAVQAALAAAPKGGEKVSP